MVVNPVFEEMERVKGVAISGLFLVMQDRLAAHAAKLLGCGAFEAVRQLQVHRKHIGPTLVARKRRHISLYSVGEGKNGKILRHDC